MDMYMVRMCLCVCTHTTYEYFSVLKNPYMVFLPAFLDSVSQEFSKADLTKFVNTSKLTV